MELATWILVIILSVTLLIFLIVSIILICKLLGIADEAKKVVIRSQDIADNANGIVSNVKGMTSIGGVIQGFIDNYVEPKMKKATKEGVKDDGRKCEKE